MEGVSFDEEPIVSSPLSYGTQETSPSGLGGWLVKSGVVKTTRVAERLLLIVVGLCVVIAFAALYLGTRHGLPNSLSAVQIRQIHARMGVTTP